MIDFSEWNKKGAIGSVLSQAECEAEASHSGLSFKQQYLPGYLIRYGTILEVFLHWYEM